jgi:hypothetical protein
LAGGFLIPPLVEAEDWQVVWKDSMQQIRVDRDSVRVDGQQVEYWYSDEVDALVDRMEHRYRVVSDCENNRMRHLEVYDPMTGETRPVQDSEWKEMSYDPDDPIKVMHHEVCDSYPAR